MPAEFPFLSPPQRPDELGRLANYRVVRKLGSGGMGIVFLAEDLALRRPVALKVMRPELAARPVARKRFLREAQACAAVRDERLVTIFQVGEQKTAQGPVPFLAMDYLQGETLDDRLERVVRLPPQEVVRIAWEVAAGLAAAHARGLVHRDIKPGNLFLEAPHWRVRILDFGLVRTTEDSAEITAAGTVLGTPAYMSPEQAIGTAVDHRADLFSLGSVLYRCLVGHRAFDGPPAVALFQVTKVQPPAPHEVDPALPVGLSLFVMRLLEKEPDRRPASAVAALQELSALVNAEQTAVATHTPQPTNGAFDFRMTPPGPATAESPPTRPGRGRLTIALGGLLLVGVLIGLGAWVGWRRDLGAQAQRDVPRPEPMDTTSLMGLSRAEVEKVQRSWADYLGVPVEIADVIGSGVTMEFVLVPPGKFVMGSPPGEAGRAPNEGQRTVEIVEPFYLGKDEVTQQQWQTVMNDNPSYFRPGGEGAFAITGQATSRFPVENVSWTDAEQFTKTLTRRGTGGVVYRLPTEAEWEYACRGGRGPSQPFGVGNGSSLSSTQANFNGTEPYGGAAMGPNLGRPSKVGSYAANALGLRDMHGNVWEWCADKYPANTGEELRVNRGGGWFSNAALCRAAHRDGDRVEHQLRILGVRLARSVASR